MFFTFSFSASVIPAKSPSVKPANLKKSGCVENLPFKSRAWMSSWRKLISLISACEMGSLFTGLLKNRSKKLKVCFAHGGGSFLPTLGRIIHGWECRPDLVAIDNKINPKNYLGKFWVDSHVCDDKMLQYVIDMVGADKIVQGSDYPFPLGEHHPGKLIESLGLDNTIQERLLNGTALEWLGVKKEQFI